MPIEIKGDRDRGAPVVRDWIAFLGTDFGNLLYRALLAAQQQPEDHGTMRVGNLNGRMSWLCACLGNHIAAALEED